MALATKAATDPVRTAVRFSLKLPLRIVTREGVLEAETENISANGILFTGPQLPKIEEQIEFTISMPAEVMGSSTDVTIQCVGRVIRHQIVAGKQFAAAIIDEYFLRV